MLATYQNQGELNADGRGLAGAIDSVSLCEAFKSLHDLLLDAAAAPVSM